MQNKNMGSLAVAQAIGITQRRVQQLTKAGIFQPKFIAGFAAYDVDQARSQYADYLNRLAEEKERKRKALIGQRFGKLVVTCLAGISPYNHILYRCRCDCGNTTDVRGSRLLSNHTGSCGKCRGKQSKEGKR